MDCKQPVFEYEFIVAKDALDQNGHVNNVVYVRWMQDVAVLHSDSAGGTRAMEQTGGTWVVRSHEIEYLSPAYEGDRIQASTWVEDVKKVRCTRRYEFKRSADNVLIARGVTLWVFVDVQTGRPRPIPAEVLRPFLVRN